MHAYRTSGVTIGLLVATWVLGQGVGRITTPMMLRPATAKVGLTFGVPRRPARPHPLTRPPRTAQRRHRRWLAQLIQAEAGNQPFLTQLAVGAVALNRLRTPGFPHRWRAMLHQPGQFTSVANGTWATAIPSRQARRAARQALTGWDPTHGALYFYNPSLPHAAWMSTLHACRQLGAMQFCL